MLARRLGPLLAALWLTACAVADFDRPGARAPSGDYAAAHPYYAEFCALSQIKKKPGFGADIRGEIGGHAVFYLNGACRIAGLGYPVLGVCDGVDGNPPDGVGLSMNEHFVNAKWVATPGRAFFYGGGLAPGAALTRDGYRAVQAQAQRLGIYDGIKFQPWVYESLPGWAPEDAKYEVSVATDYAIGLGRGRYCARVPVSRAQMVAMVDWLNAQNAPYRSGLRTFEWSVFTDNCIHLAHNALTVAGLWPEWRTGRPLLVSMFDFPTPKNEFVNLMRRTNDLQLYDLARAYADRSARLSVLDYGRLPALPGALATGQGPQRPNEVYETDLKLVFFDDPNFGPYQGWFDSIFADPGQLDPAANAVRFATAAGSARAARRTLAWWTAQRPYADDPEFPAFYEGFYRALSP